ncbi:MAG: metallophosphoesterase [Myxococcota bacterium]
MSRNLVEALQRHGVIAQPFFEALLRSRPIFEDRIAEIALLWNVQLRATAAVETPVAPSGHTSIQSIFQTTGTPEVNFVAPIQLPQLKQRLRLKNEGLVVEGASGVGKTTAVRHALAAVLGVALEQLWEHHDLLWLTSKDTRDRTRLNEILNAGYRKLSGHLVIDDFHQLSVAEQERIADFVKLIADASRNNAKITLIGINPVGNTLVRRFRDVTGRFAVINFNRQPPEKIRELITLGEASANLRFQQREQIVSTARGSFYTAQLLCSELTLSEGILETLSTMRVVVAPLTGAIENVQNRLRFKYHHRLLQFASHDELPPPPRGATFALLWLLSQNPENSSSLSRAMLRFPALKPALSWLMQSRLATLFEEQPELSEILFYNRDAGMLSIEDPQLDFYLNHLSWPALARDSGHQGIQWDGNTPIFPPDADTPPATRLDNMTENIPDSGQSWNLPSSWVLHISDLHIDTLDDAVLLYQQLREDLVELGINALTAVIVSGDVVNRGTPVEYQAAGALFRELKERFKLRPQQFLIVPGNHDLDWGISKKHYRPQRRVDWGGPSPDAWHIESGDYVEIANIRDLQERFSAFSSFYSDVCSESYPLDPEQQATIRHYPEARLLMLGLNSSWAIDHHHTARADINARALGRALERIDREPAYRGCLRLAVWHHPISSADEDRIRDTGFLERLAKADFRLGLHGHIHMATEQLYRYDVSPAGRRLDLLGAGTFGAPMRHLQPGYPLQYQLLRFEGQKLTIHTRRRETLRGSWKPDARWTPARGHNPLPYYIIEL